MSNTYIKINATDIHKLFSKECWNRGTSGSEIIYDYPMKNGITVRVCTSLRIGADTARSKGSDAIRIYAFNPASKRGVRKSVRVYRTPGWDARVKNKVQDMIKDIKRS